ncbi:MraY family glycosyltransferase [Patulibacter sp. NPDC049589]|uniref:MraY family glycosyltransferase n=1 Tax=Patulibacter sp. NPDC049589 TaxID=3154731 RepID=UPI0034461E1A
MTWRDPIVGLLVAFAISAALTPLVARAAVVVGAVDRPSDRGLAAGGTPLLGGLAILVAVVVAVLLEMPDGMPQADNLRAILLGAVMIAVVGAVDDRFDLHWSIKLVGQVAAAWIPVSQGVQVENITFPFLGPVQFADGPSTALTIFGFVVLMNVVNLSDGIDGLAAGVSSIAAVAMGIVAWDLSSVLYGHAALLAAATAGAALGFLVHNFHPARVFMGDTGAMLLGYLLAAIAVEGSVKTNAVLALVVPFVVLALPVLDTTFVVLKRLKSGVPIYNADQNHFHHRLSRIGFSPRRTVAYLYLWAGSLAGLAVALRFVPYSDNRGHFDVLWTTVMGLILLGCLAVSFYLVTVLEILKLRRLDALRLRRSRPEVTEDEIDADVAHALETGEFSAITGEHRPVGGAD